MHIKTDRHFRTGTILKVDGRQSRQSDRHLATPYDFHVFENTQTIKLSNISDTSGHYIYTDILKKISNESRDF